MNADQKHCCPCVAGIISFIGETSWSLTWVLPREIAPVLAHKFTGFEIPFDSPDMGEMAAELVNVLAGDVVAQLEKRCIKAQMSLPTVARGDYLEFTPARGPGVGYIDFTSSYGKFREAMRINKLSGASFNWPFLFSRPRTFSAGAVGGPSLRFK